MRLKFLGLTTLAVMLATPVMAASDIVAQVSAVKGDVKVENLQGKRVNATPNMQLANGSTLIVLKGNVTLKYKATQCKYSANSLVTVTDTKECPVGQQIAVGATGAPASVTEELTGTTKALLALAGITAIMIQGNNDSETVGSR